MSYVYSRAKHTGENIAPSKKQSKNPIQHRERKQGRASKFTLNPPKFVLSFRWKHSRPKCSPWDRPIHPDLGSHGFREHPKNKKAMIT